SWRISALNDETLRCHCCGASDAAAGPGWGRQGGLDPTLGGISTRSQLGPQGGGGSTIPTAPPLNARRGLLSIRGRRPDCLRPCRQARPGRRCLEAQEFRLPVRPLGRLAQNEELGCAGRKTRGRGRLGSEKAVVPQLEFLSAAFSRARHVL